MAYITKRGSSYSVRYTYQDEHGKSCDKWESFPTKEEATNRKKQIEHELATGTFLIPSSVTVAEFLMDWLPKQCSKHKWAPKTYQSNLALIQNLIIPYIGEMQMQKLRPYHIEALYDTLSKTPCGQYVGGKRRDLSPKQQKRTLSGTTLHEVHQLLHNSFLLAVEWGILIKSPVPVEAPKKTTQERSIWEVEEMRAALDSMEDPILHLAVHLTLVGALREGEVAGLTPEDIDFDAANGMGTFTVNRSMQRVQKDTLAQVDKGCILRIFPDKLEGSKTSLILKDTKTEASCRTIFMTAALREELKQWLERLKREEALDPERYRNSGMLLRLPNGLAVEPVLIRKKFLKWQDAHPEFPRIVFHGLRHPYVKHTTKIFSLRLMDFQAQAYPDARRKTRGACQLLRVGQSRSPVRPLYNRKRFSCLPPQSKMSWILYAISMRLSGYTSTRSISISASSVVSASASKIALDASFRLSCRACSSCFCFACANTAA